MNFGTAREPLAESAALLRRAIAATETTVDAVAPEAASAAALAAEWLWSSRSTILYSYARILFDEVEDGPSPLVIYQLDELRRYVDENTRIVAEGVPEEEQAAEQVTTESTPPVTQERTDSKNLFAIAHLLEQSTKTVRDGLM